MLLTSAPAARAQVPEITSNRPGIAESESLLVPRAFQLESGLTFAKLGDLDDRETQVDFPEATLRFGLTPRLELFLNGSNLLWNRTASTSGASVAATMGTDLSLNAKVGLLSEDENGITLSAAMGLSLPVGTEGASSDSYDPSLRLLWSKALPRDFGVNGNLNISATTSDSLRAATGAASIGLGRPIVESTAWFVELFGDFINGGPPEWQLDGGVSVTARDDLLFDLSAGRTLKSGPSAWFVGAGVTRRFRR